MVLILIPVAESHKKQHRLLSPISAPSVYGLSFLKMIELVGLFPWNTWVKQGEISHNQTALCMPSSQMLLICFLFIHGHWGALPPTPSLLYSWCSLVSHVFPSFNLLCVAGFSPELLHWGRWPPAPSWPPLWSCPSSELLSGPGSWPTGSTATSKTHTVRCRAMCWHIPFQTCSGLYTTLCSFGCKNVILYNLNTM